jgi:ribonuclease P protein component
LPPPSAQNNKEIPKGYLRRRSDFLKTYKGFFVRKEHLVLYVRTNGMSMHRFGVTAPKTVGPAVVRNKFKRWSRELYRGSGSYKVADPVDINLLVGNKRLKKEDFKSVKFEDFKEQFTSSLRTALRNFE